MSLIPMDLVEVQCDRCGAKFCEDSGEFCAILRGQVEEYLTESEWEIESDNHLCPDCIPLEREDFEEDKGAKP